MIYTSRFDCTPLDKYGFQIQISERVDNAWETLHLQYELDSHAYQRSLERRIGQDEIAAAIMFGYWESKQGVSFYAITRDMVPRMCGIEYHRKEGLVVICDEGSAKVKTCFRRNDPVQYIKRKPKYLKPKERVSDLWSDQQITQVAREMVPHRITGPRWRMIG
jgi:hypothetical protein